MTLRIRRVGFVVAISVLAYATTASAECAWVLWVGTSPWQPWDAYQSRDDCAKAMLSTQMKKIVEDSKQQGLTLFPVCLPDTVDPRGPKGGGR